MSIQVYYNIECECLDDYKTTRICLTRRLTCARSCCTTSILLYIRALLSLTLLLLLLLLFYRSADVAIDKVMFSTSLFRRLLVRNTWYTWYGKLQSARSLAWRHKLDSSLCYTRNISYKEPNRHTCKALNKPIVNVKRNRMVKNKYNRDNCGGKRKV